MGNEVMTAVVTHNIVLSKFTLAFFEDMGWYIANYDHAEPLAWGMGKGCDFLDKGCKRSPV